MERIRNILKKKLRKEKYPYYLRLLAVSLFLVGSFLLGEHLYLYGFDIEDFPIGHEYYGLLLIILSIIFGIFSKKVKNK